MLRATLVRLYGPNFVYNRFCLILSIITSQAVWPSTCTRLYKKIEGNFENVFHVFGLSSKLSACGVNVVASGVFFMQANQFLAQTLSREAQGAQNLRIFRINRLLKMNWGVLGVFCIINCYFTCFYEIQCNLLYIYEHI